jgi:hypothetical protein
VALVQLVKSPSFNIASDEQLAPAAYGARERARHGTAEVRRDPVQLGELGPQTMRLQRQR